MECAQQSPKGNVWPSQMLRVTLLGAALSYGNQMQTLHVHVCLFFLSTRVVVAERCVKCSFFGFATPPPREYFSFPWCTNTALEQTVQLHNLTDLKHKLCSFTIWWTLNTNTFWCSRPLPLPSAQANLQNLFPLLAFTRQPMLTKLQPCDFHRTFISKTWVASCQWALQTPQSRDHLVRTCSVGLSPFCQLSGSDLAILLAAPGFLFFPSSLVCLLSLYPWPPGQRPSGLLPPPLLPK